VPKVEFREEVANVALPELLEQRGLSEGRYVANAVDGKGTSLQQVAEKSRFLPVSEEDFQLRSTGDL